MTRLSPIVLLALFACSNSGADIATVPPTTVPTETVPKEQDKAATGVDVIAVTAYQGVEISLFDASGDVPDIQAPLIRNRDTTVRVFVNPHDGFEARKLRMVLEVEDNNGLESFELRQRVEGRSYRGQLETTFNFDIPGDLLKVNTEMRAAVYEVNVSESWAGEEGVTTWDGGRLDPVKSDTLNIVLIPVRYNADGSGRVPDTSDAQVGNYRDLMKSMYPVEDLVVTVGPVLDWNQGIGANGSGWGDLLYQIADMRDSASVDQNTYYYGIFNPDDSFADFCNFGCVLGLSNLAWNANDPWYRSSIGLGYVGFGNTAATTFVHEVGHAHGREHADCGGAQGIDNAYPYGPDAIIGSWGYDTRTGRLYDPSENHDLMGYCEPMWISDYQYYNLYLRISAIGGVARQATIPWQTVTVGMDGEARFDKIREFTPNLGGDPVSVELIGLDGRVIERVDGLFTKLSHIDGGMVMIDPIDNPAVVDVRVPALEK